MLEIEIICFDQNYCKLALSPSSVLKKMFVLSRELKTGSWGIDDRETFFFLSNVKVLLEAWINVSGARCGVILGCPPVMLIQSESN